ncbi:imm11 family protein [Vitiosangium sp. GDMCC 1.1324]|uniref:imm11 family protein n=1 Tax=Vitiosangium sp. (strain GDMCC 1.1324) TaxID=2138576 RepID=UPI000D355948|nr:DUF1629 domain-containing protein [Vitiosangium sp. GDMCC 1.1324]PTL83425.1 hypothetical protein DAT35_15750 [Vitiosangium sp. GDMCC 1.1324]
MDYLIWRYNDVEGACSLLEPSGIDSIVPLKEGTSIWASLGSAGLSSAMNPESPTELRLLDNVHNTDGILVVSERLHAFLDARGLTHVEYLPMTILDHEGRVASKDYWVVHPIEPVDAIDMEASGCKMSRIKKTRIQSMERLVLRPEAIPAGRELFRLQGLWGVTLVSQPLADAITAAGFTGVDWTGTSAYPGA